MFGSAVTSPNDQAIIKTFSDAILRLAYLCSHSYILLLDIYLSHYHWKSPEILVCSYTKKLFDVLSLRLKYPMGC